MKNTDVGGWWVSACHAAHDKTQDKTRQDKTMLYFRHGNNLEQLWAARVVETLWWLGQFIWTKRQEKTTTKTKSKHFTDINFKFCRLKLCDNFHFSFSIIYIPLLLQWPWLYSRISFCSNYSHIVKICIEQMNMH